jgi:hypothetical protein
MKKHKIGRLHDKQAPARSEYTELVDIDQSANDGLQSASGTFVEAILGAPESKQALSLLRFKDVGPFKVEGLELALDSLCEIMSHVNERHPDLYTKLSHNGMRVVKKIAGKRSKSLHSWGIAIDIKIDGVDDVKWNEKSFLGLALIAPIFHDHGWYWGGAFRDQETEKGSGIYHTNEDAMHFEVSKNKLLGWAALGYLGPVAQQIVNSKETRKLMAAKRPAESKRRINRGGLTVTVLAGHAKPSSNPLEPTPLPAGNMLRKPLPRRSGEAFQLWLGRTATSWAKSPSSWFR